MYGGTGYNILPLVGVIEPGGLIIMGELFSVRDEGKTSLDGLIISCVLAEIDLDCTTLPI